MGQTSFLLDPGMPPLLEYAGPAQTAFAGQLGPPGTVKRKGRVYLGCILGGLLVVLIPLVALLVLIGAALLRS